MSPDAITQTSEDFDAETVAHLFPALYAEIEGYVKLDWKSERIDEKIAPHFSGWKHGDHYRGLCKNAAKSIHRKHELELAQEALKKAGTE